MIKLYIYRVRQNAGQMIRSQSRPRNNNVGRRNNNQNNQNNQRKQQRGPNRQNNQQSKRGGRQQSRGRPQKKIGWYSQSSTLNELFLNLWL